MSHHLPRPFRRVLALEVRPQKIGFVVFGDAEHIIDFGVRSTKVAWRKDETNPLARLLDLYTPSHVVTRRTQRSIAAAHAVGPSFAVVRAEAKRKQVEFRTVEARKIDRFYSALGCSTKHQVTLLIAERFEEISWKVPPKRKLWQPEDYRSCIFDAAATGAYVFAVGQ